jgi:membrane-bound lytic murein transglycosylase D
LVRYLEFFKDDPRGRSTFTIMYKRAGRYRELIRRTLRRKGVPEDLTWVAMVESGFDPTVRSPVGAAGLWQFMPETGKSYGLAQDRWLDQRFNVQAATEAAAEYLSDLHRRFGSWELALASYNMGYGGVSSLVRRYNTNDFWALAHTEAALPWETSLYVPKILALGIVTRNLAAFGYADITPDPPMEVDEVHVAAGTPLTTVAAAAGCTTKELEALNPELRASRVPPAASSSDSEGGPQACPVKVPAGKGAACTQALARAKKEPPAYERYVVRFGETLDQIAAARKVTAAKLVEMNGMSPGEAVRGGTVLLVPKGDGSMPAPTPAAASAGVSSAAKTTVIVPGDVFAYPDRRRVFYRVLVGDTLREIASTFHVPIDDVRRWNNLDPTARLMEGMTLQVFVPSSADLSNVVALEESEANVLAVGSDEFFAHLEALKGYKRITVPAKSGDTLEAVGKRYNVAAKVMERANRRGRSEPLKEGETVVVYLPSTAPGAVGTPGVTAAQGPEPNGPLPTPPVPDLLP